MSSECLETGCECGPCVLARSRRGFARAARLQIRRPATSLTGVSPEGIAADFNVHPHSGKTMHAPASPCRRLLAKRPG